MDEGDKKALPDETVKSSILGWKTCLTKINNSDLKVEQSVVQTVKEF